MKTHLLGVDGSTTIETIPSAPGTAGDGEHFMVSVEGSEPSIETLRWATRVAAGIGARVDVVTT